MGKILAKEKSSLEDSTNEELKLTPDLLEHPLFNHSNDQTLSIAIEALRHRVRPVPDTASADRLDTFFFSQMWKILDLGKMYKQTFANIMDQSNISSCGKAISAEEIYFRCLDCELCEEPTLSKQCQECFMLSNHEGHRIIRNRPIENIIETCDCGVHDMMKLEGCCPKHQHKEQTVEEALKDFPEAFSQDFTVILKKIIYAIICLFEMSQMTPSKRVKQTIHYNAMVYMITVLEFCRTCVKDISKTYLVLFEVLMQSKFEAPYNLVWHDCDDLSDKDHEKEGQHLPPHPCRCSILGTLMRFSRDFSLEAQTHFTDILVECSREKRFRDYLIEEVPKYSHLIFPNPTLEDTATQEDLKLPRLLPKILTPDIDAVKTFKQLIETARRAASNYTAAPIPNNLTFLHVGFGIAYYIQRYKDTEKVLIETDLMKDFLELLRLFQTKVLYTGDVKLGLFEHNIDYASLDQIVNAEKCVFGTLEIAFQKSRDFSPENKLKFFKNVASVWHTQFQQAKNILDHERLFQRKIYFTSGLEEMLCAMIVYYLDDITSEGVEKFMREFFPNTYPSSLATDALSGVLTTIGIMRFVDILTTTGEYFDKTYYFTLFGIFELDIIFTQLMTLLIRPEDLFSVFARNFFSYSQELQDFCEHLKPPQTITSHPNSKQMVLALEDFLRFLIFVMNDETCLMNLILRDQLTKDETSVASERIVRKLLINILLTSHWTDIGLVKLVYNEFLSDSFRVPTNKYLAKIIVKDDETYRFKLKDEFESKLDPYIFYKRYLIQKEQQNSIVATERVNVKQDLVSGQYYTDLPEYLKKTQLTLFQSQLPEFLSHLLNNFSYELSDVLHPALKLVLLNLQVVSDLLANSTENTEILQNKIKENYLKKDFSKNLNKIAEQSDFQECRACIGKIQGFIKEVSMKLLQDQSSTNPEEEEKSKESLFEEKKRQAKEKMERLKGEFAKKQAVFAEKNETLLAQITDSPEPKKVHDQDTDDKELVCQYCLAKIEIGKDEYGVPIYVEFTNNLYKTDVEPTFIAQDYPVMSDTRWFPVISSCNHYYHQKCFTSYFEGARALENEATVMYTNEFEVQCTLCKTLCNNFLTISNDNSKIKNEDEDENDDDFEDVDEDEESVRSCAFVIQIQSLLVNLKNVLLFSNNADQQFNNPEQVELEMIYKRSYEYFIETFYLHEKPQSLEEAFKLYINYFRVFQEGLKISNQLHPPRPTSMQEMMLDDKVYVEGYIKNTMFELLQGRTALGAKATSEEGFLKKEHINQLKAFISSTVIKFMEGELANTTHQPKEIFNLYNQDKTIKDKMIEKCFFSMIKILFIYHVNKCVGSSELVLDSEILKLFCNPKLGSESLDLLIKRLEISDSFDQFVQESFVEFEGPQGSALSLIIPTFTIKPLKLAPHYIELPRSYLEFNQKYFKQVCTICQKVCHNLLLSICMICGEVICTLRCDDLSGEKSGNLSTHSSQKHLGLGLYYGIDHPEITIVKCPLAFSVMLKAAYVDELGQNFTPFRVGELPIQKHVDFKEFNFDRKAEKMLKNIVTQHSFGKEIFEREQLDPEGLADANRL